MTHVSPEVSAAGTEPTALQRNVALLNAVPLVPTWLTGLAVTEFPPHLIAAHLVSSFLGESADRLVRPLLSRSVERVLNTALEEGLGVGFRDEAHSTRPVPHRVDPAMLYRTARHRRRFARTTSNIRYGPHDRANRLDVWRGSGTGPAPVLIQIPGGAWMLNDKRGQAYPLMGRMVDAGWVCVSIDYRRSPGHAWPAHGEDVKRAIAWVREHIADYGGDPDFIAVTGGSADGHLAALAALTPNARRLQPGFEEADISVQAAVPLYGVYDLTDTAKMRRQMVPYLARVVMGRSMADAPDLYAAASPITHVDADAPPFFILHGHNDSLIPNVQATTFASALRNAGAQTVCHADVPNAEHAFDLFATVRCQLVVEAVATFLEVVRGRHLAGHYASASPSAG